MDKENFEAKELSMRHSIHSLKQKVDNLTKQLETTKQKKKRYYEELVQKRREVKRLNARCEWLQMRYDNLVLFIKEKGLKPPTDNNDSDKG